MPTRKPAKRRKKVAASSLGLSAQETAQIDESDLDALSATVTRDGGAVLGRYRDPVGGKPVLVVALPVDRVEPTPYQREPSDTHVKRLMGVIEKIGIFLDPIIVIRQDDGVLDAERQSPPAGAEEARATARSPRCWCRTPRSRSRSSRSTPRRRTTFGRSRSRRSAWRARSAKNGELPRQSFAFEFEQPSYLTLGVCYEERPRIERRRLSVDSPQASMRSSK